MKQPAGYYLGLLDPIVAKLPLAERRSKITDNEILSKHLFHMFFGFTYDTFLVKYHMCPSPLAQYQVDMLMKHSIEINVSSSPLLSSELDRDANGNLEKARLCVVVPCTIACATPKSNGVSPKVIDVKLTVSICRPDTVTAYIETDSGNVGTGLMEVRSAVDLVRKLNTVSYYSVTSSVKSKYMPEVKKYGESGS